MWRLVDRVIAIAHHERDTIAAWTPQKVVWIPIAVPLEAHVVRRPELATVLFVDALDYAPNSAAATLLARQVPPRVRRQQPRARLELVGRRPTAAV